MENNYEEELKKKLYSRHFEYTEKGLGACFYAQDVMRYMNGVEKIIEEQQKEIERLNKVINKNDSSDLASESARQEIISKLKEKLDKQIKANGEINQTVTDLNKPIGLNEPNIYKPDSKK